ncbi:MerR family transcriptional regulator [Actinocorallia sp. B10E7]|uniref:MerR family transcriptional regulator n=1 Tax=Actinocorallia sp. B10E7 TaxID=3153558 RepID=UPI00325F3289
MRIGELAALVGVSTRTVRHYHGLGLLPEPERRHNGYREYRLRDAVLLARIRRLAELGVPLEEIREVTAGDRGRELREVLLELDADLARQQEAIAARRERLALLLAEAEPHPDSAVSPEMGAVLRGLPAGGSKFAAFDREMLALVDTAADERQRAQWAEMMRPLTTPEALARSHELYRRLDELDEAEPGDPRVAVLAADLAAHLPEEMAAAMAANTDPPERSWQWLEEMAVEVSPAQAEVFRLLVALLREKR